MIKIIIHSTGSIAISSMFISGCGLFVSPTEKPTIEDHSGNLGVFSTVAQRRMVVTKKDYRGSDNRGMRSIWSGKYESKFCAEPPPDAAESIASTFSAVLQASAEQKGADLNLAGELARSLQTTVEELFN